MRAELARLLLLLSLASSSAAQDPSPPPPAPEEAREGDAGQQADESSGEAKPAAEAPPATQEAVQEVPPAPAPETGVIGADLSVLDPAPAAESVPAPAPGRPAIAGPLAIDEIEKGLRDIAALHPEVARLEVIGRSAGGREILVLSLSDHASGPSTEKPGLFVVDHQAAPGIYGAELALELAWTTVERFASDESVRALLRETTLVIAPALDPDVRVPGAPAETVLFDRNFPLGWQPETVRKASGRYPMSRPETRAAAQFLERQHHLVLALAVAQARPSPRPFPGAELPLEDREVMSRLAAIGDPAAGPRLLPWHELGSPGGGFLDYAYQARGIYPLAFALPSDEELASAGLAGWLRAASEKAGLLLALLPRLSIEQDGLERLAPGLWQVDIRIKNQGKVPTLSTLGARRAKNGEIAIGLTGAKLVATARRALGGAAYQDASFHESPSGGLVRGGTLAGGEERWFRLVVEGEPGSTLALSGASTWTAGAQLSLVLP